MNAIFYLKWVVAFSPILTVLVLMVFLNWSGSRVGSTGWLVAWAMGVAMPSVIRAMS